MVLTSQLQADPSRLQSQDAPAVSTVYRSLLFSSGFLLVGTLVWLISPLPSTHLYRHEPLTGFMVSLELPQPPSNGFFRLNHWALMTALTPSLTMRGVRSALSDG